MADFSEDETPNDTNKIFPCSAFFYGTLMAPQVLHRVCHGSMEPDNTIYTNHQLKIFPALLHNFRRHRVQGVDYPAIVPRKGASVRGTVVSGLTREDIRRLDTFEGAEYRRDVVKASILAKVGDEQGKGNVEGDEVEVETYVWVSDLDQLEDASWDFAEFQQEKLSFWASAEGEGEYAEVDKAVAEAKGPDRTGGRGANGHLTKALEKEHEQGEKAN